MSKGIAQKEIVGNTTFTKDVSRPPQDSNPRALPASWSLKIKKLIEEVFE